MSTGIGRALVAAAIASAATSAASASPVTFYTNQAAFETAASPTLIEDFESVSPKDTALPTLTHNDITYTPFAGSPSPNVWVASPGYTNFGPGVTQPTTTSILVANGDEDFLATFATPFTAVGFDVYLNGLGPATVSVMNGATILDTFTFPDAADDKEFLGFISAVPITGFRWTSTLGGRLNTGIDNIEAASVPEPATLLLVGSGLVAAVRRRRR